MPLIEDIVSEHLRFAYSPVIKKFVSMGFYSGQSSVYGPPGTEHNVCAGLSYLNVERLLFRSMQTSMLTLPAYWKVYQHFESCGLTYAMDSLRHPQFVELLDTIIFDNQRLIHASTSSNKNNKQKIQLPTPIPSARPALIRARDGDLHTGLPSKLHSADIYDDPSLWRYWSPDPIPSTSVVSEVDTPTYVATRGHIFVMNQTSLDLKVRIDESTQSLTFRPIYNDIPDIRYKVSPDGNWIRLAVFPRLFSLIA